MEIEQITLQQIYNFFVQIVMQLLILGEEEILNKNASVTQLVDVDRLKRSGEIHAGSSPVASTKHYE